MKEGNTILSGMGPQINGAAALRIFNGNAQLYTDGWRRVSAHMDSNGVYSAITDQIDLSPGELHIDFCSGPGTLLRELRKRFPEAMLLGVEQSESMLDVAETNLSRLPGPDPSVFRTETRRYVPEKRIIKRTFEAPRANLLINRHPENPVFLIQDSVRDLSILKAILGDRRIDSASLTFPGGGNELTLETPGMIDLMVAESTNEITSKQCTTKVLEAVRPALRAILPDTTEFLSRNMPRDGRFLFAKIISSLDMLQDLAPFLLANSVACSAMDQLGDLRRYWDLDDTVLTAPHAWPDGGVHSAYQTDAGELVFSPPSTPRQTCIATFRRNGVPFGN